MLLSTYRSRHNRHFDFVLCEEKIIKQVVLPAIFKDPINTLNCSKFTTALWFNSIPHLEIYSFVFPKVGHKSVACITIQMCKTSSTETAVHDKKLHSETVREILLPAETLDRKKTVSTEGHFR